MDIYDKMINTTLQYLITVLDFRPEMYQEPKKLAELQLGVRNFCGDFNARNKEKNF